MRGNGEIFIMQKTFECFAFFDVYGMNTEIQRSGRSKMGAAAFMFHFLQSLFHFVGCFWDDFSYLCKVEKIRGVIEELKEVIGKYVMLVAKYRPHNSTITPS